MMKDSKQPWKKYKCGDAVQIVEYSKLMEGEHRLCCNQAKCYWLANASFMVRCPMSYDENPPNWLVSSAFGDMVLPDWCLEPYNEETLNRRRKEQKEIMEEVDCRRVSKYSKNQMVKVIPFRDMDLNVHHVVNLDILQNYAEKRFAIQEVHYDDYNRQYSYTLSQMGQQMAILPEEYLQPVEEVEAKHGFDLREALNISEAEQKEKETDRDRMIEQLKQDLTDRIERYDVYLKVVDDSLAKFKKIKRWNLVVSWSLMIYSVIYIVCTVSDTPLDLKTGMTILAVCWVVLAIIFFKLILTTIKNTNNDSKSN